MSMTVAILSDTHIPSRVVGLPDALPQKIFQYLRKVDLILHAGDIFEQIVLDELASYAPVRAVRGNHDSDVSVASLPEVIELVLDGVHITVLHDSGLKAGRRNRLRRRFPDTRVIVFGHSHQPGLEDRNGLMLLNPGSAKYSFALLHINGGGVSGEIVDLATGEHRSGEDYPPISTEAQRNTKNNFGAAVKRELLERANHRCQTCSSPGLLEIVHITPPSEGGGGSLSNGQVLCRSCRIEKSKKDRRQKELRNLLKGKPDRPVPAHRIDRVFDHLSERGAILPVCKADLYGLSKIQVANKLLAVDADYLALDLLRNYISGQHDRYYGILGERGTSGNDPESTDS